MWKLTISQTTKRSYLNDGEDTEYDYTENVVLEHERLCELLQLAGSVNGYVRTGNVKYTFEKVGEK